MNAYIFQADVYCDKCAELIQAEIIRAGQAPQNTEDEDAFDSGEYPKGPYEDGGGEADCPQHCANCHVALLNPLTTVGVQYVIDSLEDSKRGDIEILRGWAKQLSDYSLNDEQQFILDNFERLNND